MVSQLWGFLEETAYLDPFQSGFRTGDLRSGDNSGRMSLLILLGLSAVFSILQHLVDLGVTRSVLQRFGSFLSDRAQSVMLGDHRPTPWPLAYGAPQG